MEYGLIGEKLGHSFSKIIHGKLFGYEYELKELARDKVEEFFAKKAFSAIASTVPRKVRCGKSAIFRVVLHTFANTCLSVRKSCVIWTDLGTVLR